MPVVLDPDAAAVYKAFLDAGRPPYETLTPPQARGDYLAARPATNPEPPELQSVAPLSIPAPHGAIPARVYRPMKLRDRDGLAPCLVFFHGGGFVIGNLDSHDVVCRKLAHEGELVVISVDYRLAPEHKFPAAVDDAITATAWISDNASTLGIDAARLCVGGDSAGGNLAAVTALMARDRNGPELAGQLLLYPVIAPDFDTESYRLFGRGYYNPKPAMQWYWDCYVPSADDRLHPYAAPLRADLVGMPHAVLVIAGHDPLRDEGLSFGAALEAAGVPIVQLRYDGGIHGFMTMPMLDLAHRARKDACAALADLLHR
jgi:acetyl esterase